MIYRKTPVQPNRLLLRIVTNTGVGMLLALSACGGETSNRPGTASGEFFMGSPTSRAGSSGTTQGVVDSGYANGILDANAVGQVVEGGEDHCTILASDFDQSCASDTDCVAVQEGNLCGGGCTCSNAAVRTTAVAAFQSAAATIPKAEAGTLHVACPCAPETPYCFAGKCDYGIRPDL
jgi:hypothetical protein